MLEKYQGKSGQGSNEYPKGQIDCSPQKSSETKKIEISNRWKKARDIQTAYYLELVELIFLCLLS